MIAHIKDIYSNRLIISATMSVVTKLVNRMKLTLTTISTKSEYSVPNESFAQTILRPILYTAISKKQTKLA